MKQYMARARNSTWLLDRLVCNLKLIASMPGWLQQGNKDLRSNHPYLRSRHLATGPQIYRNTEKLIVWRNSPKLWKRKVTLWERLILSHLHSFVASIFVGSISGLSDLSKVVVGEATVFNAFFRFTIQNSNQTENPLIGSFPVGNLEVPHLDSLEMIPPPILKHHE